MPFNSLNSSTSPIKILLDKRSIYLRKLVLDAFIKAGKGHVGGALSCIEIIRVLYDDIMNYRPKNPLWHDRDRFILSKGHSCLALYVVLADKGFFSLKELESCFSSNSFLGGHPERDILKGIEASTGSLGHGLSIGVGLAIAARNQRRDSRIFVLLGDGELNEGSIWEALLSASKHRLSNLTAIIDYNKVQSSGTVEEIQNLEPISEKFKSFGFETIEINGHDIISLQNTFNSLPISNNPTALICHTVKGKGLSIAEGNAEWHYKRLKSDDIKLIYSELEKR